MTPTTTWWSSGCRRELDRRELRRRRQHGGGHQLRGRAACSPEPTMTSGFRAVPDSGDDDLTTSAWSDCRYDRLRSPTPVPGGMGDLNVTWEADNSITWIWEPVAGEPTNAATVTRISYFARRTPAERTTLVLRRTWDSEFSETPRLPGWAGRAALRPDQDDDDTTRPFLRDDRAPTGADVGAIGPTDRLWRKNESSYVGTGIDAPANFNYEINIADARRDQRPLPPAPTFREPVRREFAS